MKIGLTGGIGSGKSTVASLLAERGAIVVSADEIAREIVQPGCPVLDELTAEFGADIITETGELNRQLLAHRAFASREQTMALDAIMHPHIRARAESRLSDVPASEVVVYDMPLLVETKQMDLVDYVVVVDVPLEVQRERAIARGLVPEDVDNRIARQASREERLAVADFVIDNSGDHEQLKAAAENLWAQVTRA